MKTLIKPQAARTGKMSMTTQPSDITVPIGFTENMMTLWEQVATGTTDTGKRFSIGQGGGLIWVTFEGKHKLKGSLPKITLRLSDLVEAAEKLATENDLIES